MSGSTKIASRALALAVTASALAACAPNYYGNGSYYGGEYRGSYGVGYGYDDCYGRNPLSYCGYPTFSGSVFIEGRDRRGLHYRDGRYGRQFWYGGRWRYDDGNRRNRRG